MRKSRLTGKWIAGKMLTQMKKNISIIGEEYLMKNAQLYLDTIVQHIENQDLNWIPLDSRYVKYKKSHGLDDRILIATGDYVSKIKIHRLPNTRNKIRVFVGGSHKEIHKPSGLTMQEIASIFEYGTEDGRMPARGHYRVSWHEVLSDVRKNWLEAAREIQSRRR